MALKRTGEGQEACERDAKRKKNEQWERYLMLMICRCAGMFRVKNEASNRTASSLVARLVVHEVFDTNFFVHERTTMASLTKCLQPPWPSSLTGTLRVFGMDLPPRMCFHSVACVIATMFTRDERDRVRALLRPNTDIESIKAILNRNTVILRQDIIDQSRYNSTIHQDYGSRASRAFAMFRIIRDSLSTQTTTTVANIWARCITDAGHQPEGARRPSRGGEPRASGQAPLFIDRGRQCELEKKNYVDTKTLKCTGSHEESSRSMILKAMGR